MGSKYKLSIIVPVYNVELYLDCCINSLLNQDMDPEQYEIILINDGSTDGSLNIAEAFNNKYKQVKLISQINKGLSSARNKGLAHALGEYILFVDSDDFFEPHAIRKILEKAEKEKTELCFFRAKVEFEDRTFVYRGVYPFQLDKIYTGEYIITHGININSVWHTLYSSQKLKEQNIQFTTGIIHEDIDFNMRLYPKCERIMFTDILGYHYRHYGESITRTTNWNKISKQILSHLQIAENIFSYIRTEEISQAVKDIYVRKMNSLLVSQMIRLLKFHGNNKHEFLQQYFEVSVRKGLYPIGHLTMSWRSSLLTYLFNTILFKKSILFLSRF